MWEKAAWIIPSCICNEPWTFSMEITFNVTVLKLTKGQEMRLEQLLLSLGLLVHPREVVWDFSTPETEDLWDSQGWEKSVRETNQIVCVLIESPETVQSTNK